MQTEGKDQSVTVKRQKGERARNGSRVIRISGDSQDILNALSIQPDAAIAMLDQKSKSSGAFDIKDLIKQLRPVIREECNEALQQYVKSDETEGEDT